MPSKRKKREEDSVDHPNDGWEKIERRVRFYVCGGDLFHLELRGKNGAVLLDRVVSTILSTAHEDVPCDLYIFLSGRLQLKNQMITTGFFNDEMIERLSYYLLILARVCKTEKPLAPEVKEALFDGIEQEEKERLAALAKANRDERTAAQALAKAKQALDEATKRRTALE